MKYIGETSFENLASNLKCAITVKPIDTAVSISLQTIGKISVESVATSRLSKGGKHKIRPIK